MTTSYESNVVLSTKEYDVVGSRPIRHDGADKVTGSAKYGADTSPTGLIYGKILRSPHAHARIVSIDTNGAEALATTRAIVTGADFTGGDGEKETRDLRESVMATLSLIHI